MRKKIIRAAGHATRWTTYVGVALLLLGAVIYVAGRLWLPTLMADKARIEQTLSKLSGQQIAIEHIEPHWDGAFPGVAAYNVQIIAADPSQPSVALEQVRVTMSLLPLLQGRVGIHRLVVVRPSISLERRQDKRYRISGFKPTATGPQVSDGRLAAWLFAQRELRIEDGQLHFVDHRAPETTSTHLLGVDLSLVNSGNRHRLTFNADFPAELCIHCSFDADIEGNPLEGDDWGGRINIEAVGLDINGLPHAARSQLPSSLRGRIDVRLRTQWVQGRPRVAQGELDAFGLILPAGVSRQELPIERLRGNVRWQGRGESWRLDVNNVLLALGGEPWSAGYLRLDHNPDTTHARIHHIAIEQLISFGRRFELPDLVEHYLAGLNPTGGMSDVVLKWDRRPDTKSRFQLRARLNRIAINNFNKLPGIKGLSGHLVLDEQAGDFHFNTRKAEMSLPHVFRETLAVRSLLGQLHWERKEDRWDISARDIRLAGDASARGNMLVRLPYNKDESPYLKLRFDFNRADARQASKYLPVNRMKPTLVSYLDQSIVSGYGVSGHVVFDGETRHYPFRDGNGTFEVLADIRDAEFQYLPGWKPITAGELSLLFRGPEMLITAHSGRVDSLAVHDVVVRKRDLKNREEAIHVTGRLTGPAESALAVLRGSPLASSSQAWRRFLAPGFEAQGPSALNLDIKLPREAGERPTIDGEFRLRGANVAVPVAGFRFNDVHGQVGFRQGAISRGEMTARFLGEPTAVNIIGTEVAGVSRTTFRAEGRLTAAGLARHFGAGVAGFLSGNAKFNGELVIQPGRVEARIKSDLAGFETVLPAPYHSLALSESQPVLETVESSYRHHRLRLRLGERATGVLDFGTRDEHWQFTGGHIALGKAALQLPEHDGLHISLHSPRLHGDAWTDLIAGGNAGTGLPDFIQEISADIGELDIFGRQIGQFRFDAHRKNGQWAGSTTGDTMTGEFRLGIDGRDSQIELDLTHLRIPEKTRETRSTRVDPRTLPSLSIKAKQFVLGETNYGALDFWAAHTDIGWRVMQCNITRPELTLIASGNWYSILGRDSVELNTQIDSNNLGALLTALGAKDQLEMGKLALTMGFRWREDETRPGLRNLDGSIELKMKDGTLLNVKQGAARLAGALNFAALTKYASLDFEPVTGAGFPFREIAGRVAIKNGNAYSDGIKVDGASADIVARGRVGLAAEDFDLTADIYPNLRGGLTLATGWLWGPATAAWILAAQEILKKEIAEGTRITYTVSGKWRSPKIERVVRKPSPDSEQGE
ncbi:MAG: hypothetical protein AMJ68_01270 [Acidithiobacillales bacterium SG8_45]|nr:MAG: hypothetical protein AMJ68_01270 [Acidithiobacillales bacterium SG8_45]